jgi:hypothetical protein
MLNSALRGGRRLDICSIRSRAGLE